MKPIKILIFKYKIMKITFEKLTDGSCVITVKGKNIHGNIYIRQEIIKSSVVFDALRLKIEGK
jgi:hypothetical protein